MIFDDVAQQIKKTAEMVIGLYSTKIHLKCFENLKRYLLPFFRKMLQV